MAIYNDVFSINAVYKLMVDGEWVTSPYVATKPGELYGWFGGGLTPTATASVDRITYASDTTTATTRGSLAATRYAQAATGNGDYGWHGLGGPGPAPTSTTTRIDYANDGASSTNRGIMTLARMLPAATGTANDGWWTNGAFPGTTYLTRVDRMTYATDTATTSARGNMSVVKSRGAATTDTTTYGWFGGGYTRTPLAATSAVDRITYANDTATATARGPLAVGRTDLAATGNFNYGWYGGGSVSGVLNTTYNRIDYASDASTALVRGTRAIGTYYPLATGTDSYGYWTGNGPSTSTYSTMIQRMTYATDTNATVSTGNLVTARQRGAATGGMIG